MDLEDAPVIISLGCWSIIFAIDFLFCFQDLSELKVLPAVLAWLIKWHEPFSETNTTTPATIRRLIQRAGLKTHFLYPVTEDALSRYERHVPFINIYPLHWLLINLFFFWSL